jgi:methanogenic corrinoid protein MtbC1
MTELSARPDLSDDHARRSKRLIDLIADLDEKQALSEITDMLASDWKPTEVMESCILAMREVGKRYEEGRYFIAALIMAGEIMRQTTELLEPYLPRLKSDLISGTILLGTIAGDIHDLGKNLFAILARCEGFQVADLGVDVEPERFLTEAKRIEPDLIGISCVLTLALPDLKKAVELLRKELPPHAAPVMVGGNCIDEHIFKYVKADYWSQDAAQGIQACQKIVKDRKNAQP